MACALILDICTGAGCVPFYFEYILFIYGFRSYALETSKGSLRAGKTLPQKLARLRELSHALLLDFRKENIIGNEQIIFF